MDKVKKIWIMFISILLMCLFVLFSQIFDMEVIKLGDGFIYSIGHKHILGTSIDVPPTIISYAYDKHYIVAKQRPKRFNEAIYDNIKYDYPLGRDTVYYWLIIKQELNCFGPLDYERYQELRKEYNVPDELKLK